MAVAEGPDNEHDFDDIEEVTPAPSTPMPPPAAPQNPRGIPHPGKACCTPCECSLSHCGSYLFDLLSSKHFSALLNPLALIVVLARKRDTKQKREGAGV